MDPDFRRGGLLVIISNLYNYSHPNESQDPVSHYPRTVLAILSRTALTSLVSVPS
jgi:hypothetical protein